MEKVNERTVAEGTSERAQRRIVETCLELTPGVVPHTKILAKDVE